VGVLKEAEVPLASVRPEEPVPQTVDTKTVGGDWGSAGGKWRRSRRRRMGGVIM